MEVAVPQRQSTADPDADVSAQLERRLRALALGLAVYALAGGVLSFAGWVLDLPRLTDWINIGVSIQPNTTLAVIAAGAGLVLLARGRRRGAEVLGIVVTFIAGTALLEWLLRVDLGIDAALLFGRTWGRGGVLFPGRMGPPGAVSWTLVGVSLMLAARGGRGRAAVPSLAALTAGISLLSLIGYSYNSDVLYTLPRLTVIAFQTSTFVMACSLALALNVAEHAPMRWLTDPGPAGTVFRRAAPLLVFLPLVLGSLSLLGDRLGIYDIAFGTALRTVVEIGFLLGLLWWSAEAVARQVALTAEHERAARAVDQRLTALLGGMDDTFCTFDPDWR